MASATNTLAGILLLKDQNNAQIDVSNLLDDAPLLKRMAAVKSSNATSHMYNRRTVAAGAAFRAIGVGLDNAAGQIEQVTCSLKLLDATVRRDIGMAKAYGDPAAYMAKEAMWALRAAFAAAEAQIINGTSSDAGGFAGLKQCTAVDDVGDTMVVDAGGSGGKTVYLIRSNPEDVALITNGDLDIGDMAQVAVYVSSASYPAFQVPILTWMGLQYGSTRTVGRIYNLDGTANHTLTDDLISSAISKFPAARRPNLIVMDRTSQAELQQSRTATNPTGAPAPFPESAFGIEIVVSDGVSASNTLATTTT